tara:strand:+ start:3206 stop:3580 length:375 start_codon:yes stop_codon:yes gene_type:complete
MKLFIQIILTFAVLANFSQSAIAEKKAVTVQCDKPRDDIFTYSDGSASINERWSDGRMVLSEALVVGFDPRLLKAVFYNVSGPPDSLGLITIFEINFAIPSVTEHRIGPNVHSTFQFKDCRRLD